MRLPTSKVRPAVAMALSLGVMGALLIPSSAAAQAKFEVKSVAEKNQLLLEVMRSVSGQLELDSLLPTIMAQTSRAMRASRKAWSR